MTIPVLLVIIFCLVIALVITVAEKANLRKQVKEERVQTKYWQDKLRPMIEDLERIQREADANLKQFEAFRAEAELFKSSRGHWTDPHLKEPLPIEISEPPQITSET